MDLSVLEKNLKHVFRDKALLQEALTHRSYLNENKRWKFPHNERLEFLGDAVLELAVTEYLFKNYNLAEGILTSYRAALVNAQSLSLVADTLRINDFLLLSKGEAKDASGKARQEILGNALEAVVGAIYLDAGYAVSSKFIEAVLLPRLSEVITLGLHKDPKSRLQEEAQARLGLTPLYKPLREWGPDHAKRFLVAVYLGEDEISQGEGGSKQEAEVAAAQQALIQKGWNSQ